MVGGTGEESGWTAGQMEFDLEGRAPFRVRLGHLALAFLGGLGRRAPLWIPLLVLAQVLGYGWLPTQAESRRIERAEAEVRARTDALENEARRIDAEERMLNDEIYRERVRKSLLDPQAEPLRLESTRRP